MEDEFKQYLEEIANNSLQPPHIQELATKTLEDWNRGITPNSKILNILRDATISVSSCDRHGRHGACTWLRKYGEANKLPVPPLGQRAYCCFIGRPQVCPGFRKAAR